MGVAVETYPDTAELVTAVGDRLVAEISASIAARGRALIVLTGGGTGIALLKHLGSHPVDWARVHLFWGDDRYVAHDDDERNEKQAREALLDHIDIPAGNIHPMPPSDAGFGADLDAAARAIIQGASYDNNLLCIGEKEVFVVASVADKLLDALRKAGAVQLDAQQIEALADKAFVFPKGKGAGCPHPVVNRDLVGRDAAVLAKAIGLDIPASTQLLFGETKADHIFVDEEQMMPFIPVVRVPDVDTAIAEAIKAEHGYKHTGVMHSQNIRNLTKMAQEIDTTLFIKNGPCMTGLGLGGEGFLSFSIATPTGEGVTTPMTFTRSRRCVMVENLNLY